MSRSAMNNAAPIAIRNRLESRVLEIQWSDASTTVHTHRSLRLHCRCTHCRSYALVSGSPVAVQENVQLQEILPVGLYGVQLLFSDGHSRGVYPWEYLRQLEEGSDRRLAV